ncbi:hypothetical protein EH223_03595 [candidate division KSB1 bacterium]|nr:hypothetical protein [candidate division KSB1 bacterium]RQW05818.1 MAG: hypothetical protein EH223_03595 [candidate division KSB1 bacterium]
MKICLKLLSIILIALPAAYSDSFYSSFGLGVPQYLVSSQSAAMGGAGIGIQKYLAFNSINPASVYLEGFTTIAASYQGEKADNTVSGSTVTTRQGNAAGFQFAFPMYKNRLTIITSLKPLVKSQLTIDFAQDYDGYSMQRTINSSGGISAASIGGNYSILPGIFIGGLFNFNFGAYTEKWKTEFDRDTYINTTDNITSHAWGTGVELGVLIKPNRFLSLGGVVKTSSTLRLETTVIPGSGVEQPPIEQTALYPTSIGGGLAFNFNKFLIAGDLYAQLWKNYEIDGNSSERMTNYIRGGAGIQFLQTTDYMAAYYKRISYRMGAYYAQLPFLDVNDDPVYEMFVTGGMGFPFNKNAGRIDLALEYGERGSTEAYPYSEKLIRLSASITMAEKWFQRLY